jgi:outer membrane lipoprotein-sorting protein
LKKIIVLLILNITLFASSYNFDEYKFVSAASITFKQSGNISFEGDKTIITYSEPKYKQIVSDGTNITIQGSSSKKLYKLKGKALFYTKLFIDVMSRLGEFKNLKNSRDFDVKKQGDLYEISFKRELEDQLIKGEGLTKDTKVKSFKLFMKNGDTIEIVKR